MHRDRVSEKALLRLAESRGIDIDRLCEDSAGVALLGSHDGWRIAEAEEAIDVAALDLDLDLDEDSAEDEDASTLQERTTRDTEPPPPAG